MCDAALLGARHVTERLRDGSVYLVRYNKCSTFTFFNPCINHGRSETYADPEKRKFLIPKLF